MLCVNTTFCTLECKKKNHWIFYGLLANFLDKNLNTESTSSVRKQSIIGERLYCSGNTLCAIRRKCSVQEALIKTLAVNSTDASNQNKAGTMIEIFHSNCENTRNGRMKILNVLACPLSLYQETMLPVEKS